MIASFTSVLESIPWYAWIAIVAIVGGGIQAIVKSHHRHTERMAMISKGMHPDSTRGGAPD